MEFIKTGEKEDLIRLSDGKDSAWFEFIEMTAHNGFEYAAILQQGEDEPVIMRFDENGEDGKEHYYTIDDDSEFNAVLEKLNEITDSDE